MATKVIYHLDATNLKEEIDNLPEKPKSNFTVPEIAAEFKSQITSVLKKGYSFTEFVDAIFKPKGINIDPNYLRKEYNKLINKPKSKNKSPDAKVDNNQLNETIINEG